MQETFLRAWRHIGGFEGSVHAAGLASTVSPPMPAWTPWTGGPHGSGRRTSSRRPLGPGPASSRWSPGPTFFGYSRSPTAYGSPPPPGRTSPTPSPSTVRRSSWRSSPPSSTYPPRRRAVFVLRDVLGWPARQTAEHLGVTEASVTSALHRARSTLRERLPERRADWAARDRADRRGAGRGPPVHGGGRAGPTWPPPPTCSPRTSGPPCRRGPCGSSAVPP